jgi:hypothetical protein
MRPSERSSQPRAHRHRRLPLWHPPDGCARGAPSRVQAAIGQNSTKTAFRTSFFISGGHSSAGRSRGAAERRRGSPPGPSAPSGRRRRARGRPTQIPGAGKGLTTRSNRKPSYCVLVITVCCVHTRCATRPRRPLGAVLRAPRSRALELVCPAFEFRRSGTVRDTLRGTPDRSVRASVPSVRTLTPRVLRVCTTLVCIDPGSEPPLC